METPEEQDFQTLRPSDFPSANLFINLSGGTKSIPNKALNKAKIHCAWISTLHSLHHRVRLNPIVSTVQRSALRGGAGLCFSFGVSTSGVFNHSVPFLVFELSTSGV